MEDTTAMTGLENSVAAERERVEEMRRRARSVAFREAGIDTTAGVGKAAAKLYDGAPDPSSIREFFDAEFGKDTDNE